MEISPAVYIFGMFFIGAVYTLWWMKRVENRAKKADAEREKQYGRNVE